MMNSNLCRGSHSRKRYLDEGNQNGSESFVQLVDCKAGSDMGFCAMSASYPKYAIQNIIKKCKTVIDSFLAEVSLIKYMEIFLQLILDLTSQLKDRFPGIFQEDYFSQIV